MKDKYILIAEHLELELEYQYETKGTPLITHATRASLPPHLSCIMNFLNQILKVLYIGSHRKKLSNQTLEIF